MELIDIMSLGALIQSEKGN